MKTKTHKFQESQVKNVPFATLNYRGVDIRLSCSDDALLGNFMLTCSLALMKQARFESENELFSLAQFHSSLALALRDSYLRVANDFNLM